MTLKLKTGKFKLIGGSPGIDFVNTVAGRAGNPSEKSERDYLDFYSAEKLKDYADLVAWSFKTELIDEKAAKNLLQLAADEPQAADKVLKRAVSLRESIYRLFKSVVKGWQPELEDLEILNRELSIARKHRKLFGTKEGFGYEWLDRENALDSMLWRISESAAEFLTTGDLTRIRQCGGDNCGWMFIDTSRNRSRNWCDMKDCGNLAKVRRFRQKTV